MTDSTLHEAPLRRGLKNRHIQLIAPGGAIGTGLFLGSAGVLATVGPSMLLGYAIGGLIAFLLMIGRTYLARTFTHEQRVHAIVTSYYWHFVDIVWIILFAVIYLIR